MRRLAYVLLLLTGSAFAEWKSIAENETGITYFDTGVIARTGNMVSMWTLLDYKAFQRMVEVGYFSQKARVEFDCTERKFRGLSVALHAEHMGEGKIVYADETPHEWQAIASGTMTEILWKVACE